MMRLRSPSPLTALILVFVVTFAYFLLLQGSRVFADPDSFYHVKVAQLIGEQGFLSAFPWLTYTKLAAHYTDQHFLYHVFLLPFVTLFPPIFGAKVATALINAALITLFAAFFIKLRVRFWLVYIGILLATNPFLFRINLVKAPGLSIILLLIGWMLLVRRRPWALAALGFAYVWTYGGFTLLIVLAGVYAAVQALYSMYHERAFARVFRRVVPLRWHLRSLFRRTPLVLAGATAAGVVLGVVANPFFPHNLSFYWQQLVQIGIVNFQTVINVGGEWRPYGFVELVAGTVFVSIALLFAVLAYLFRGRRQTPESWTLLVMTVFFFLITLKSRRYVELYVPFAVLFAAYAHRDALRGVSTKDIMRVARRYFLRHTVVAVLLAAYFCITVFTIVTRDTMNLYSDLKKGTPIDQFAGVGTWLKQNTQKDSIVVTSDWDEFPPIFYQDSWNRYIIGLDPTFMYVYDAALYERWAKLTMGQRSADATAIITKDLRSRTVIVTKDHQAFRQTMQEQKSFSVVYEDNDAWIYQLKADAAWPAQP